MLCNVPQGAPKEPGRGKGLISLGPEEKGWGWGIADAADHQRLKFRRLCPALSAARRIKRRAIRTALGTQHSFNATEGIACHGDPIGINEFLRSQPCKRGELVA